MSSGLDYGMHNVFDLYNLMRPLKTQQSPHQKLIFQVKPVITLKHVA